MKHAPDAGLIPELSDLQPQPSHYATAVPKPSRSITISRIEYYSQNTIILT